MWDNIWIPFNQYIENSFQFWYSDTKHLPNTSFECCQYTNLLHNLVSTQLFWLCTSYDFYNKPPKQILWWNIKQITTTSPISNSNQITKLMHKLNKVKHEINLSYSTLQYRKLKYILYLCNFCFSHLAMSHVEAVSKFQHTLQFPLSG
jgi:hypothetical protein